MLEQNKVTAQNGSIIGQVLDGRYQIKSVLGRGGMGTVYLATQHPMERDVAIKVLTPEAASGDNAYSRFEQEVRVVSQLNHTNCVTVFDFGRTPQGLPYVVMEYLQGRLLTKIIKNEAPMSLERSVYIVAQVCDALAEAHDKGVVHRDLKTDNIVLLQQKGHADFVKVLDFGLAKVPSVDGERSLTQGGMVVGTPAYMSPEQVTGEKVEASSDIYSLGVVLFELLTGRHPFTADNSMAVMIKHVEQEPPLLSEVDAQLSWPAEVDQLLAWVLAKDPEDRPASASEFKEALENLLIGRPDATIPDLQAIKSKQAVEPSQTVRFLQPVPQISGQANANPEDYPRENTDPQFRIAQVRPTTDPLFRLSQAEAAALREATGDPAAEPLAQTAQVEPLKAAQTPVEPAPVHPAASEPGPTFDDTAISAAPPQMEPAPSATQGVTDSVSPVEPDDADTARVDQAQIYQAKADLDNADPDNADLDNADPDNAAPDNADLDNADRENADLGNIDTEMIAQAKIDQAKSDLAKIDLDNIDPAKIDLASIDLANLDPAYTDPEATLETQPLPKESLAQLATAEPEQSKAKETSEHDAQDRIDEQDRLDLDEDGTDSTAVFSAKGATAAAPAADEPPAANADAPEAAISGDEANAKATRNELDSWLQDDEADFFQNTGEHAIGAGGKPAAIGTSVAAREDEPEPQVQGSIMGYLLGAAVVGLLLIGGGGYLVYSYVAMDAPEKTAATLNESKTEENMASALEKIAALSLTEEAEKAAGAEVDTAAGKPEAKEADKPEAEAAAKPEAEAADKPEAEAAAKPEKPEAKEADRARIELEAKSKAEPKTKTEPKAKTEAKAEPKTELESAKKSGASFAELYADGTKLLKRQKYSKALKKFEAAMAKDPGDARVYTSIGQIYFEFGKGRKALSYYKKAEALSPNTAKTHLLMGLVLHEMGKLKQAKKHYQKYLKLNPKGEEAAAVRGLLDSL